MTLPLDIAAATPIAQPSKPAPMDGIGRWRQIKSPVRKQCDACLQVVHETWPHPPMHVMAAKQARTVNGVTQLLCSEHAAPLWDLDEQALSQIKNERKTRKKR